MEINHQDYNSLWHAHPSTKFFSNCLSKQLFYEGKEVDEQGSFKVKAYFETKESDIIYIVLAFSLPCQYLHRRILFIHCNLIWLGQTIKLSHLKIRENSRVSWFHERKVRCQEISTDA